MFKPSQNVCPFLYLEGGLRVLGADCSGLLRIAIGLPPDCSWFSQWVGRQTSRGCNRGNHIHDPTWGDLGLPGAWQLPRYVHMSERSARSIVYLDFAAQMCASHVHTHHSKHPSASNPTPCGLTKRQQISTLVSHQSDSDWCET